MADSLLSPSWYRVAQLKPGIRSQAQFHRHHYRDQLWYVLQDHSTGRCHRLTPAAYHLAGLMNGERTTQEIWEATTTQLGDDAPTQDETIRLLGLLHFADVLRCNVSPDTTELFRRCQRRESAEWWRRFANPLAFRIPLLDPDDFLERMQSLVQPLFSWPGAVTWCLVVGSAVFLAGANWPVLSEGAADRLLDPRNLLLMWLVYPFVKALHELGHAFATKVWGGEVHEMGVMFLVLVPIPYVDASAASAFPDKRRRMAVGAMGILVELFLASVALLVWLNVEPGWVRSVAYNVMWIGGASTLLFNGNPLLRFDGYYVLQDAVEIPNLGARSNQYLAYLVLHHGFGTDKVRYPVSARGEQAWFVGYGVAAFLYRLTVLFAIAVFIAGKFFALGVLLVLFAVTMQIVVPLARHAAFVLTSPRLAEERTRAVTVSAGFVGAFVVSFLLLPSPLFTRAEGVVWPPEGTQVRARADGFVVRVLVEPGAVVRRGELLILTQATDLEARVATLEARLKELRAQHHAEQLENLVTAQITQEEISAVEAALAQARERAGEVLIRSPANGSLAMPPGADLVGRFLKQGELIGYVVGGSITTARAIVPQSDIALVRDRTEGVELRLSSRISESLPARIRREVPAATDRLPSRALGTAGGGQVAVDPRDSEGVQTLERVFHVDVTFPEAADVREIGGRVYVRFHHGSEPLALRTFRGLRRLFLKRIDV